MTNRPRPKQNKTIRLLLIAGITAALLILAAIIVIGVKRINADEPIGSGEEATVYGDEYLGIDPGVDEELKDYRNLIVFGIDKDEQSDKNGKVNDDFIIISFHKNNDEMKMCLIDGDTYLKIEDDTYDTVCEAYNTGGMDRLIKAVNRNLDLNIREGLAMEWDALVYLVDAIGGIELQAEDGSVRPMTGNEAVRFARTDHNMQTVFTAAFAKAKTMKSSELTPIMDELLRKAVKRGMSRDNVTATLMEMAVYETRANIRWPYTASSAFPHETDCILPETLQSNVIQLHSDLFRQTDYETTGIVQTISDKIKGKTGQVHDE